MAPLSELRWDPGWGKRALGDLHNSTQYTGLTDYQENVLQVLALTSSAISVTSSVLAFYWFLKMRRSFRHDLIMLLIQSDMFKALWFMVYPIVTFASGRVNSHSRFCQVNGFFLSVGIEASDVSVLMIAVHSALYIFRPKTAGGEGGLYPYRRFSYAIWALLPFLLAGLAFINQEDSYVSDGTYCYLPVRPFWYRLALSWIPRYLIFLVILSIYASIYFYVAYKFRGFAGTSNRLSREDYNADGLQVTDPQRRSSLPPTPPLACHGLIPVSRHTSANDADADVGKASPPIPEAHRRNEMVRRPSVHQFMILASFTSRVQPQLPSPPSDLSVDSDSFTGPSTPHPIPQYPDIPPASPQSSHSMESSIPSRSRNTSWRDNFVRRFSPEASNEPTHKPSSVDIFSILRRKPGDTDTSTPISELRLTNSRGENLADADMLRTRDKIRRQLRFLFIYPLVYIGMWIVPFASHIMQYDDRYAVSPPFGLTCVTTICVTLGAAVDCWLFSTREKPWKHIPDTNGGFWESLRFWTGWKGVSKRRIVKGPGRTRDEMVKEARSAYRRRDEELAQRKMQAAAAGVNGERSARKGEKSWWDTTGFDGPTDTNKNMSPVVEENNPLDLEMSNHEKFSTRQSLVESDTTLRNSDTTRSREICDEITPIGEEDSTSMNEKDDFISMSTTKKHGN